MYSGDIAGLRLKKAEIARKFLNNKNPQIRKRAQFEIDTANAAAKREKQWDRILEWLAIMRGEGYVD
jgi:hypothetical protein